MSRMSRRDDGGARAPSSRRSSPAGASPASVSAGAPSSRPRTCGESCAGRAGCQEPLRREPVHGPQHHVKLAASSDLQPERRAGHVAAKTTPRAIQSGDALVRGLGGVRSAARGQGAERNTRDPSVRAASGPHASHKSSTKPSVAPRESEGTIVPSRVATKNAVGGKGPCGGHVDGAGKREGMAAASGSNDPDGRKPVDKVRRLQRRLCGAAKRSPERRFHALYNHLSRSDVLDEAWKRVSSNRGAAGVDKQTIADIEQCMKHG